MARATGQGAGVREGWGARRRPPQEGKWAGLRGAGGAGAPGRAARRARARGVVASPKAEAAAGARRWRACEARAVVLPALLFPLLSGWRRPRRCWARSPFLSLRRPLPVLSRPSRAVRCLRRKTVPARVSGSGGGADAAGRPGNGAGAGQRGAVGTVGLAASREGSRGAAGPGPARTAGRRVSSGACQALQVAG